MHGLRRLQQYSTQGHLSAHGMPHRPCVIPTACGSARQDIRTRPRSPSLCPLSGDWGLVTKVRSLPSARGPGTSVEVAAAPGAWRGCGEMRRGQRGADRFWRIRHQPRGNKATMLISCLSASRRFRQGCSRRVRGATPGIVGVLANCQKRCPFWPRNSAATAGVSLPREATALCPLTRPRP
jgi:hypothetical protein